MDRIRQVVKISMMFRVEMLMEWGKDKHETGVHAHCYKRLGKQALEEGSSGHGRN